MDNIIGSMAEPSSDVTLQYPSMLPGMNMEAVEEPGSVIAAIGAILEADSNEPADSSVDTSTELDSTELSESTALSDTTVVENNADRENVGISQPESLHKEGSQSKGSSGTSNSKRAVAIPEDDQLDGCGVVLERPAGDVALCDA